MISSFIRRHKIFILLLAACAAALFLYSHSGRPNSRQRAATRYLESYGWTVKRFFSEITEAPDQGPLTGEILTQPQSYWGAPFVNAIQAGDIHLDPVGRYAILQVDLNERVFARDDSSSGLLRADVLMSGNQVICAGLIWIDQLYSSDFEELGIPWNQPHSFSLMLTPENYCPVDWSLEQIVSYYTAIMIQAGRAS